MFERPKTSEIPDRPGAYMFRDKRGRVIYVGKAKSLRSRVSSYFDVGLHPRTQAMSVGDKSSPFLAPAGGGDRTP